MILKNILKIMTILPLLATFSHGAPLEFVQSMKYETNYDVAIKKAKADKKQVILVLSSSSCPWCRKMENKTLKDSSVDKIIKEHFIPLTLDKDKDSYPQKFEPEYVPTVLFIDPKKENYFTQSVGYKNIDKFKDSLDEAIEDVKRLGL